MALSANKTRDFNQNIPPRFNSIGVKDGEVIYAGAALGEEAGTGYVRPFTDGDPFVGFAENKVDMASPASLSVGDLEVRVRRAGEVQLVLGGTVAVSKIHDPVFATDDDTFSLTDSGGDTQIGKLVRYVSSTIGVVAYEGVGVRSI